MPERSIPPNLERSSDDRWARWCFDTCLIFGCDPATGGRITALFIDAIAKEPRHAR